MSKKVLSLGQCAADNYAISHFLESSFGAEVIAADTVPEAALPNCSARSVQSGAC